MYTPIVENKSPFRFCSQQASPPPPPPIPVTSWRVASFSISFPFSFFLPPPPPQERTASGSGRVGERGRGKENPKQAPCAAGSPMWAQSHDPGAPWRVSCNQFYKKEKFQGWFIQEKRFATCQNYTTVAERLHSVGVLEAWEREISVVDRTLSCAFSVSLCW